MFTINILWHILHFQFAMYYVIYHILFHILSYPTTVVTKFKKFSYNTYNIFIKRPWEKYKVIVYMRNPLVKRDDNFKIV